MAATTSPTTVMLLKATKSPTPRWVELSGRQRPQFMLSVRKVALITKATVPSLPPARWWMLWWTVQPSTPTTPHAYLCLGVFCCASKTTSLLVEARLGLEVGCFHGKGWCRAYALEPLLRLRKCLRFVTMYAV